MKTIVVKIGGSVLSKESELFSFEEATKIRDFFVNTSQDFNFILVTGGGYLARSYQKLLRDYGSSEFNQHYVGTMACNINAVMLKSVFNDLAEEHILALSDLHLETPLTLKKRFLIAGGGMPGPSSDWDAAWLAKRSGSDFVITLKDIGGVFSVDPDLDPNAELLKVLTWEKYLNVIGNPSTHKPGGNLPVDPIASKFCMENHIKFFVVDGKDFSNLKDLIEGREYIGSEIHS